MTVRARVRNGGHASDSERAKAGIRTADPQAAALLHHAGSRVRPEEKAMARYPGTEREGRIEPDLLKRQVAVIFTGCGMSDVDASLLADSLVQADLRGIRSHGVLRIPDYGSKLTREGVNPRGRPRVPCSHARGRACRFAGTRCRIPATAFTRRREVRSGSQRAPLRSAAARPRAGGTRPAASGLRSAPTKVRARAR